MINNSKLITAVSAAHLSDVDIPMIPEKKKWDIQIQGCYDLLYYYIHEDYPTREEMQMWISMHNANPHNGGPPIIPTIPRLGVTPDGIWYKSGSEVNGVGYGVGSEL